MLKNLSIGQKIHLPVIFMMIVGLGVITLNSYFAIEKITQESYEQYSKNMKDDILQGLGEKQQVGLTSVIALSQNKQIIEALQSNDKQKAYDIFETLTKTYKETTNYKNIRIHLHTKDTKSFLRHWNKKHYGDDLSSFRKSLLKVKKEQKPFVTIENGRAGMLLRGIAPIIDNGNFMGSIEFIQGFNSLVSKYKKLKGYDILFLASADEENIERFDASTPKVSNLFLSQKLQNANKKLMDTLSDFDPDVMEKNIFMLKGNFFLTSLSLLDSFGEKQGCVVISTPTAQVNSFVDDAKENILEQIYILIIVDILLLLTVIYILQNMIKKPIEKMVSSIDNIQKNLEGSDLKLLYVNHRLTIDSNDEIASIKKGLNHLLKSISKNFVRLQKNKKYTKEYLRAVDAGSIVSKSDIKGKITYVNDALCETTGYTKDELIGKPHSILRHPNTPRSVFREMWSTIQSGEIYHGLFKNKRKDGSSFYANITIVPIKNDKERIVEYVALRDDVTELVNSKEQLKKIFFTDPLTSFYNRFKLLDDIEQNIKGSYLAVIDIHEFRSINDFYGHKIGDLVIVDFANRLFEFFKLDGYSVYRVHGDEFAILAQQNHTTQKEFFNHIENFINKNKVHQLKLQDNEINIRLTCGISYNNENLISETELAHKAAKKRSKEIVQYSDEIQTSQEYKANLEWTNKIKEAIKDNRIKGYFQPIVNTKNNKIEKYETLMRLIEKEGKEISPFFFLDIAKKSRLYKELTKIIVTQAFEKFAGTNYEFSINLSAEDIMLHDISEWFFELACEYKVNNQVVIELVESEGIESFDMVETFIQNAKENGMKIAIDDFGTGYSNFEYLIKLNTDYLKIDGSLIKEIDKDEKLYGVVETIVAFAKKNNIKVIAEFIASEALSDKIKELDIEYGQGFYLGKPLSDILHKDSI